MRERNLGILRDKAIGEKSTFILIDYKQNYPSLYLNYWKKCLDNNSLNQIMRI